MSPLTPSCCWPAPGRGGWTVRADAEIDKNLGNVSVTTTEDCGATTSSAVMH